MVVTGSRLEAVRYKKAADLYIQQNRYDDLRTLVAFSGSLVDPDDPTEEELTEVKMNGGNISEKKLPEEFTKQKYGILIAADKYQTGFDQPLLHTMCVDKRLAGVQAVQTLSRLQLYYDTAPIIKGSRMRVSYTGKETPTDNALMNSIVDKAVGRFGNADDKAREELRNRLDAFRRLYSFLSQVIPFGDSKLEKFDAYLRFFEKKLPVPSRMIDETSPPFPERRRQIALSSSRMPRVG